MGRTLLSFLAIIFCMVSHADTLSKNKLVTIKRSIEHIKTELAKDKKLQLSSQKALKKTKLKASVIQNKLTKTSAELNQQLSQLHTIHNEIDQYQTAINNKKEIITKIASTAYQIPNPPFLALLLGGQQEKVKARIRMYHYYLALQQLDSIKALHRHLSLLKSLDHKNRQRSELLANRQTKQLQQKEKLTHIQQSRKTIIKAINQRIQDRNEYLKILLFDESTLEKTIKAIKKDKDHPTSNDFPTLKGKLPWPTSGKIINNFGKKINRSQLRWSGILILTPSNQAVHPIAPGRVVFANWLPGYGKILIIDHGNGYMSLYGRNQALKKKVGDFVNKKDTISLVGKSGGYSTSSLYFAIRHNAKPLNPIHWCH